MVGNVTRSARCDAEQVHDDRAGDSGQAGERPGIDPVEAHRQVQPRGAEEESAQVSSSGASVIARV